MELVSSLLPSKVNTLLGMTLLCYEFLKELHMQEEKILNIPFRFFTVNSEGEENASKLTILYFKYITLVVRSVICEMEDPDDYIKLAENDELQEYYDSLLHTVNLIGARTQEVGQNTATYSYLGDHLLKGRMDRVEYQWHRYICKYTTYLTIKKSLQFQFKRRRWYNAWLTWIEEKIYLSAMEKELNIIADKYRKEHSKLISYAKKLLKEKKNS